MTPTGSVTVIAGGAGSGKTTLARAICAATGAQLLDLDAVTADLVARARAERPGESEAEVLTAIRDDRYALLLDAARRARAACDVVLAAPFTREIADPTGWQGLVRAVGEEPVSLVWIEVSPRERARRLRLRGASRDAHLLDAQEAPAVTPPGVPHLAVAAELPTAVKVALVTSQFDNGTP
jgi:predicted kinase